MTTPQVIQQALAYFDSGRFREVLARRVAIASESQRPDRDAALQQYLTEEIIPALQALGFELRQIDNPAVANRPFW